MEHKRNLADMMAILADFEQSHDCCVLLICEKYDDKMRIKRALYESALISFRRALISGSTRLPEFGNSRWKFKSDHHKEAVGNLNKEKEEILEISNRCVAHRASKEARIVEFTDDEITGKKAVKTVYKERIDLIPYLKLINQRYINLLLYKLIPIELQECGWTLNRMDK